MMNSNSKTGANLLAHNTVLNFIGQIIPLLCGVVAIPVTIKTLGIDAFGILSLAWLILGYFNIFDLGLSRSITKYVSDCLGKGETQTIPKIVWTSIGTQLIIGLIVTGLCVIFIPFFINHFFKIPADLIKEATLTFYIIAVALPVVLLSIGFKGVLEASQRFDLVNWIKIPSNSLFFIVPAVFGLLGYRLSGIVLLLSSIKIISMIGYIIFCFKVFPNLKTSVTFEIKVLKNIISFGSWVTVTAVLTSVLLYVERFFIASLLSVRMLSYYSVPYEVLSRLNIFPYSMALALFPAFSHYSAKGTANLEEMFLRPIKYLFILMLPIVIFLFIFSKEILIYWLGSSFAENGNTVFQLLVFALFLNSLAFIPFTCVQGLGRADLKAKFDIIETLLFIILLLNLIPLYGINGAASSKLIIMLMDFCFLIWVSHKLIRFTKKGLFDYKIIRTLVIGVIFSLVTIISWFILDKLAGLFLFLCVSCIYIFIIWQYAMDDKDRLTIREVKKQWLR